MVESNELDEGNYRTFVAAGKTQVYIAFEPRVKGRGWRVPGKSFCQPRAVVAV